MAGAWSPGICAKAAKAYGGSDLDTGDIDYAAISQYARAHELPRRFTVELALETGTTITRSAIENHRRSREFVRNVFGN